MDDGIVSGVGVGDVPVGSGVGRAVERVEDGTVGAGGDEGTCEVTIHGVPARLFLESQDHQQDIIREFALIHLGHRPGDAGTEAPQCLARLIAEVHHQYSDVRWLTRQQALAAIENGAEEVSMTVPVRPGMAAALRHWLDLLERADRFCEEGALLTLAATPEVRRLRRWYAEEIIRVLPAEPVDAALSN